MTASTEAAQWVAATHKHLRIDLEDQFHVDAISLLASITNGPHNIHGRPLRTIETTELIMGVTA